MVIRVQLDVQNGDVWFLDKIALELHWNCIGYSFWIFKRCTKMSDQTTSLHLFRVFNGDILHFTPPLYTPTLHQKKPFENGSNGCICVNYAKFGYF